MKLQNVAHWAEIISSVAVVATLIFLAQEVNANTEALDRQATLDRVNNVNLPFFEAPELASVLAKIKAVDGADPVPAALMERYGLTAEESILWERHQALLWMWLEADFLHRGEWGALQGWIQSLMETEDNRLYWEARHDQHTSSFQAFVNGVAAAQGG